RQTGQTAIEPEMVALQVMSLARQGVTDTTTLCLRTLRNLSGESAVNADARPTDIEYLRLIHSETRRTAQNIALVLALVDGGNALIARIERQLSKSVFL